MLGSNEDMIAFLKQEKVLSHTAVERALQKEDRARFVPQQETLHAYADHALSLPSGQTISQPRVVVLLLQWLDVKKGMHVLDVGCGSGWTTALLSHLVGKQGMVFGVERIPELLEYAKRRVSLSNVSFHQATSSLGLSSHAPFDRILVSAAATAIPQELMDQLSVGGILVIPVKQSVLVVTKLSSTAMTFTEHHGFSFVPLITDASTV